MLKYAFFAEDRGRRAGAHDPAVWHDQISLYSELGQFSKRTPKLTRS